MGTLENMSMPETSFNNRLAQRPKGKQKRFIIESRDSGVFVSQARSPLVAIPCQQLLKTKGYNMLLF